MNKFEHSHDDRKEGDALGEIANELRLAVCDAMEKPEVIVELLPFFAKHASNEKVTYEHFKRWRMSLRTQEYADELVLALTAKELGVQIVVVPKEKDWKIQRYPRENADEQHRRVSDRESNTIYLGNDDRHYVYLHVQ